MLKYIRNNKDKYDRPDFIESVLDWVAEHWMETFIVWLMFAIIIMGIIGSSLVDRCHEPQASKKDPSNCSTKGSREYFNNLTYTISGGLL